MFQGMYNSFLPYLMTLSLSSLFAQHILTELRLYPNSRSLTYTSAIPYKSFAAYIVDINSNSNSLCLVGLVNGLRLFKHKL